MKTLHRLPSAGRLSAGLQPPTPIHRPHEVPSIQKRNINHMKCRSAWTGLLGPIHI